MPGGLTATPADFEKARKYVNPVDVAAQKETRRRERADTLARVGRSGTSTAFTARRGSLVDPETAARYARDARDLNAKDAFTLDEAARRAAHREGYAAYIRSSRTTRMRAADSAADDPADPTSLGLRTQYDLRKPKFGNPGLGAFGGSRAHSTDLGPALPRADEPLWIDPANAKANAPLRKRAPVAYDSFSRSLRDIVRREGASGLYKGMVPNVLRTLPSSGVTFMVYESVRSFLGEEDEEAARR